MPVDSDSSTVETLSPEEAFGVLGNETCMSILQTLAEADDPVLSGAVTDAVVMEPTRLDAPCPFCGGAIEARYREERLLLRCTECVDSFGDVDPTTPAIQSLPEGTLTLSRLRRRSGDDPGVPDG